MVAAFRQLFRASGNAELAAGFNASGPAFRDSESDGPSLDLRQCKITEASSLKGDDPTLIRIVSANLSRVGT